MDVARTLAAVERILEESLSGLTRSGSLSVFPTSQLEEWRLPDQGKFALSSYGLPPARVDDLIGIVARFQESVQPKAGPDGSLIYILGSYGTAEIAAVEDCGSVLAVPERSKVHPGLRSLYPSGISPTPVNSSIARFVECAWRWHWIVPLLAEEQRRAGEAEIQAWRDGTGDELSDPYASYQEICGYVLEKFRAIDPEIKEHFNFWPDVIIDLS